MHGRYSGTDRHGRPKQRATIVMGLGVTGYSCIRHLAGTDRLMAIDTRAEPPFLAAVRRGYPDVEVLAARDWSRALGEADRFVVSPGIPLDHPLVRQASCTTDIDRTSELDLFLAARRPAPLVAVTGTNGKSTVATLVGELLQADGHEVGVGGNIGTPALDLLAGGYDSYVLELSSFQLERLCRRPPKFSVACVLNVTPDHLDRHEDMATYAAIKRIVYDGAAMAVYNALDERAAPRDGPGDAIALHRDERWRIDGDALVVGGERLPASELALRGRHNHCNVLAAAAIAYMAGVDHPDLDVLRGFRGLPHRSALVASVDGVDYVDDSKATNVGACQAALDGFGDGSGNIVLIAGGDGKGADFAPLADAVARHARHLVLLGRDADAIAAAVGGAAPATRAADMPAAVRAARERARPGDTVLLAPACASFDMFADFGARGDAFAAAVGALGGATP